MKIALPRRLLPLSLGGQIALATAGLLAIVQLCSIAVLVLSRPAPPPVFDPYWLSHQIATLAAGAAGRERDERIAWLDRQEAARWLGFELHDRQPPVPPGTQIDARLRRFEADIRAAAPAAIRGLSLALDPPPPGAPPFTGPARADVVPGPTPALAQAEEMRRVRAFVADLELPDRTWLCIRPRQLDRLGPEMKLAIALLILCLGAAIAAAIWAARWLSAPLAAIARAAESLGRGGEAVPLVAGGAAEIEAITRAFAAMRERVVRFVHDRTTMLVAISHDLRTPLTRMRMRAERIGDDALREAIRRDIDALEAIVVKTLDFARVESRSGRCERIDLSSLIATIVDERIDALQDVRVAAGARVVLAANGAAVRRIVENLIDNALEYAGSAEVELTATGGEALIAVADRGPGIPEAELESVFRPFHCLEGSRSRETGGTGLGLAIARTLARAHGGDVTLANRTGGGLVATVALPRDPHLPGPDCRGGRGIAAGQAEMSTLADSSNAPR